jgi:hypothetical protein
MAVMYGFIGVMLSAVILCLSRHANADVFNRIGIDYDVAPVATSSEKELVKAKIANSLNHFSSSFNLKELMDKQILEGSYAGIKSVTNPNQNDLMKLQFNSPAEADLLKHLNTISHLKMIMNYDQMSDLEININSPQMVLRRASMLECLTRAELKIGNKVIPNDLESRLLACKKVSVYGHLRVPGGINYIDDGFFVVQRSLAKLVIREDSDEIKRIIVTYIGDVNITKTMYQSKSPTKRIKNVLSEKRSELLTKFITLANGYKSDRSFPADTIEQFSVPGMPFTEQQLRSIFMFDTNEREKIFRSMATSLAYINVSNQYEHYVDLLNQVIEHPQIQYEYKVVVEDRIKFLKSELDGLIKERHLFEDYAHKLDFLDESFNQKRLELIKAINDGQ